MNRSDYDYKNYFKNHYGFDFSEYGSDWYKRWFETQWDFINKKVKIKNGINILEIGSGFGGFYSILKNDLNNFRYKGLELDGEVCKYVNDYYGGNKFKNISIENFITHEKYNYIFAFEVLEHLDNPVFSLEKIYMLLKNKGFFIGTSPYPFKKNVLADDTHKYILHPENWKVLFRNAEFKSVTMYPMSFLPYLWRVNSRLNVRLPFYIPLKYFISASLIIARK